MFASTLLSAVLASAAIVPVDPTSGAWLENHALRVPAVSSSDVSYVSFLAEMFGDRSSFSDGACVRFQGICDGKPVADAVICKVRGEPFAASGASATTGTAVMLGPLPLASCTSVMIQPTYYSKPGVLISTILRVAANLPSVTKNLLPPVISDSKALSEISEGMDSLNKARGEPLGTLVVSSPSSEAARLGDGATWLLVPNKSEAEVRRDLTLQGSMLFDKEGEQYSGFNVKFTASVFPVHNSLFNQTCREAALVALPWTATDLSTCTTDLLAAADAQRFGPLIGAMITVAAQVDDAEERYVRVTALRKALDAACPGGSALALCAGARKMYDAATKSIRLFDVVGAALATRDELKAEVEFVSNWPGQSCERAKHLADYREKYEALTTVMEKFKCVPGSACAAIPTIATEVRRYAKARDEAAGGCMGENIRTAILSSPQMPTLTRRVLQNLVDGVKELIPFDITLPVLEGDAAAIIATLEEASSFPNVPGGSLKTPWLQEARSKVAKWCTLRADQWVTAIYLLKGILLDLKQQCTAAQAPDEQKAIVLPLMERFISTDPALLIVTDRGVSINKERKNALSSLCQGPFNSAPAVPSARSVPSSGSL